MGVSTRDWALLGFLGLTLQQIVCYRLNQLTLFAWEASMRCPKCACQEDKVIDSRSSREGATIRRRRECMRCEHRFTTYEQIEQQALMVVKRDGRREEFSKDKLLNGIRRACQKRPVSPHAIQEAVEQISASLHDEFEDEVPCLDIGERVMEVLRRLDGVAYVRFASVYRRFEEATDFVQAVKKLEVRHDTTTFRLPGF
jgi:transcriptional repressor NrdR